MPRRKDQTNGQANANGEPQAEPLVDRVLELDLLCDHLRRVAGGGPGHAVLMLGESGEASHALRPRLSQRRATSG